MNTLPQIDPRWDGKYPIIGLKLIKDFSRVDDALVNQFFEYRVPDISDLVGVLYTMDSGIRPIYTPMKRICGSAFTVKCPPGDNMFLKYATQYVKRGDVIVVDARGFSEWAVAGAANAQRARDNGCVGIIIDGAYRDVVQTREAQVPVMSRSINAATGPKRGPGELNTTICCGGVIVNPGDLIIADEEGIVVVPMEYAARVANCLNSKYQYADKENWDSSLMAQRYEEREQYFNQILEARGCEFLDFKKQ